MTRSAGLFVAVALIGAAATGCGSASKTSTAGPSQGQTVAPAGGASGGLRITVKKTGAYGPILLDGAGRTLYLFTHDSGPQSTCAGACAHAWPPALAMGAPHAAGQARAALLGTTRRPDGSAQATYAGHPLYYFLGDRSAGEINCQNATEYGGTWLLVDPAGRAIHKNAPPCPRP